MRLLFMHMPKCAGRSFQYLLAGNYNGRWALWNDSDHLSKSEIEAYNKKDLIVGHIHHAAIKNFKGYKLITILRDPLTRTISEYNHMRTQDTGFKASEVMRAHDFSFMDFVRSKEPYIFSWTNAYMAYLGYYAATEESPDFLGHAKHVLSEFDFVGIYENMAETVRVLKAKYGLRGELEYHGKTDKINRVAEDLTESEKDETRALLSDDYELYNYGVERFIKDFFKYAGGA